ncbi:MAG: hypothetical protein KAX19_07855 [Candidatus Brocadiae bacterium]|nr:hypothetical protein [Candidatus Brocadiia bacterium]
MDESDLMAAAGLPAEKAELLRHLHRFTGERLEGAQACRDRAVAALEETRDARADLHAFLRECWEALDGLAREVNACMEHLFPHAGLYPPMEMTRQCTFYVLRMKLHERPETAGHPVSQLLWQQTRDSPAEAYQRLSFLYNLSLFFPLSLVEGRLPGSADLPPTVRGVLKTADVAGCEAAEGMDAILRWLNGFVQECYRRLARAIQSDA